MVYMHDSSAPDDWQSPDQCWVAQGRIQPLAAKRNAVGPMHNSSLSHYTVAATVKALDLRHYKVLVSADAAPT